MYQNSLICLTFSAPEGSSRKVPSRKASGRVAGRLRDPPGPPRGGEIDQLFGPRGPRGRSNEFFSPPEGPGAALGGVPGGLQIEVSAREGFRRPPGVDFGASGPPFWSPRGSILEPPGVDFRSCETRGQEHRRRQRRSNTNAKTQHRRITKATRMIRYARTRANRLARVQAHVTPLPRVTHACRHTRSLCNARSTCAGTREAFATSDAPLLKLRTHMSALSVPMPAQV